MRKWKAIIFVVVGCFLGFLSWLGISKIGRSEEKIKDIPIMRIYLDDVDLETITSGSKETKYEGNRLVLENEGNKIELEDVQIKGRGNSTWGNPKNPFQIKFKQKVDLLGLGERKKYILLANYVDESFLRNDLVFKITEMIDEKYRLSGEFIELYIDDEYQGLYYLTSKIEIGKNSVDLRDKNAGLFELATLSRLYEDCHYSGLGECLLLSDATFLDNEEISVAVISDFVEKFSELEIAIKNRSFFNTSDIIDVESFAEYALISDFMLNPDAFVTSFKFYRDGFEDKIHAGPLWDFDFAVGNRKWGENFTDGRIPDTFITQEEYIYPDGRPDAGRGKIMYILMEMPEFKEEMKRIFNEKLCGRRAELKDYVIERANSIREAALRDNALWDERGGFDEELEYLLDWLDKRFDFFEQKYSAEAPME